ncbi:RluA family pseudouridine synthase [Curvibacter sp. CHRR-16]|uniref:RluA family pseudouridine synthase n=1 Tax=Curvibacter sp. CHRR-16 TaxID=2835872 RepID=UPI002023B16A|nr:RluA family pseudouridine synthase [Curvibacter sp. CHRR-16]
MATPDTEEDLVEDSLQTEVRSLSVTADLHGLRLDKALSLLIEGFSRSYLQQFIAQGDVLVQGVPCTKPSSKAIAGQQIQITLRPTPASQAFVAQAIPLDVVFEDDYLLVVNKPPGLVVHPAPGNWSGTLLNALLHHVPESVNLPRAGIVHRLDKDTSGLMVVAKTRVAMDALVRAIAARDVSRQYLALTDCVWAHASPKTVDAAIGRDARNRLRMAVVDLARESGKVAKTDFYLCDANDRGSLLRCVLHTGRTHQIRVHLASLGCPIAGDVLYARTSSLATKPVIARQALHAFRLAFLHPVMQTPLQWQIPLPADMQGLAQEWGLQYNDNSTQEA